MNTIKEYARWLWAAIVAAATIGVAILLYGHRKLKEGLATGEATQRAKDDIDRVRKAEKDGDDDAVLEEWRKHQ